MPFTTAAYPATGPLSLRRRGLGGELIDEVGLLTLVREQTFIGRLLRGLRL